jgi:transposase-like protein
VNEVTPALASGRSPFAGSDWFDPWEEAVRSQVRSFIEQLLEAELEAARGRGRYERGAGSNGRRHGHRPRQLVTTFGPLTLSVPRARLHDEVGEQEWKSALLPAYQRLSRRAEALIAEAYLAGMNTRRVRRALAKLFEATSARTWSAASLAPRTAVVAVRSAKGREPARLGRLGRGASSPAPTSSG